LLGQVSFETTHSTPLVPARNPQGPVGPALAVLALVLTAAVGALAWWLPPDGADHAPIFQFLGRFHPLLVHAPIGMLILVPLLEMAGMLGNRSDLRRAAGFVLALAAGASVVAACDGWLLAWSGGYHGLLLSRHMWAGIALAAVSTLAAAARAYCPAKSGKFAYPALLAATLALLVWTGHEGGSLTQGENFLTERMPVRLRAVFGLEPIRPSIRAAPPDAAGQQASAAHPESTHVAVSYAKEIAPLFERSCVSCHRPQKHKGGLRMDSYEQLMAGGEDGAAVSPGDPKGSELIRRVTLPSDDDDFMPSDNKKALSPGEIDRVRRWIAEGARNS